MGTTMPFPEEIAIITIPNSHPHGIYKKQQRFLSQFTAWVCLPFDSFAILLLSQGLSAAASLTQVDDLRLAVAVMQAIDLPLRHYRHGLASLNT
jgi:hypothetical protein